MNSILRNSAHCRGSRDNFLISFASKHFAGGLVTAIAFEFTRPNLSDHYEIQLFNRPGWKREALEAIQTQRDAGRICMGGRLFMDIFGPSTPFVFPAYRTVIIRASKFHIRRYLEMGKAVAKFTAEDQAAINNELESYIEGGCR